VQEVEQIYGLPVLSIARLTDVIDYLADRPELMQFLAAVQDYRSRYGID
jgi:orotate phosphoribosyltransferase